MDTTPDIATGQVDTDTLWRGHTPDGHPYAMRVRPGTSDWNTCHACAAVNDEYHLPRRLTGWALDVGAHIGAATVPLLLDNPQLRVVAIEALPDNVLQLVTNLERNGVADRCIVVHGAAAKSSDQVWIGYGELHDGNGEHTYIGNANAPAGSRGVTVPGYDLRALADLRGSDRDRPWVWAKIDCEGCEYGLLDKPCCVGMLHHIEGEVHFGWDRLVQLLSATHDVDGPGQDFGPFTARLRVAVDAATGQAVA